MNGTIEFKASVLLTFGEIARISQENERTVVLELCRRAIESPEICKLVRLVLKKISRYLRYPSVRFVFQLSSRSILTMISQELP